MPCFLRVEEIIFTKTMSRSCVLTVILYFHVTALIIKMPLNTNQPSSQPTINQFWCCCAEWHWRWIAHWFGRWTTDWRQCCGQLPDNQVRAGAHDTAVCSWDEYRLQASEAWTEAAAEHGSARCCARSPSYPIWQGAPCLLLAALSK